jgi:hypothetical protein
MQGIDADFSEYIIFADESGDHGLSSINPENPIFVLAFCIFKKSDYISSIQNSIAKFKLHFWGHDLVVLHNHQIRKSEGAFSFLFDEEKRRMFMHLLNETIRLIPFSIVSTAIDKRRLCNNASNNPYTAHKQVNSTGLQIADLVAHPIARHVIKRDQPNKAFDIVKEKLLGYPEYDGLGLKVSL